MKKVLVVFGGVSTEYEVSLRSAASVIRNIPQRKYDVSTMGITKDGRWRLYTGEVGRIEDGSWIEDSKNLLPAAVSPDRAVHGITITENGSVRNESFDVVFPVLHGKNGEDGTIQGLFQLAGLPFVGCDMLSSGMSMDKAVTNTIADYAGIPQARWLAATSQEYGKAPLDFERRCEAHLGFPMFIKPANAGSSVGITKVNSPDELSGALSAAFVHDRKIVAEEGVDGIEVECSVLGNDEAIAPVAGEVVPCNDFYDYDAKYIQEDSELHIPARISEEKSAEVRSYALKVYSALGCSGLSRVDFFVGKQDGRVFFNEINTIPGFTSISMYPKMLEAAGISYPDLLDRLMKLAIEKWS